MRHRKFTFKIGRSGAHRTAMLGNMVCSLFREQRLNTTVTKAKQARRLAEKMITLAKRGRDHDRRRAVAILRQPDVVATLFTELAPRFQERQGGYTRMLKTGQRIGDAAEMCILELIFEPVVPKERKVIEADEAPAVAEAEATAEQPAADESAEDADESAPADEALESDNDEQTADAPEAPEEAAPAEEVAGTPAEDEEGDADTKKA